MTAGGAACTTSSAGSGQPVVFLHGNGAMVEDLLISGVIDQAARQYHAIAFDRPGFGHSERPRGRNWTAAAQASILPEAFRLARHRAARSSSAIRGEHSWHWHWRSTIPVMSAGLVLASGYYYPTPRTDVALFSPPAIPVVGDLISHTVAPLDRRSHGTQAHRQDVLAARGVAAVRRRISRLP